jgi:hypothetical protein
MQHQLTHRLKSEQSLRLLYYSSISIYQNNAKIIPLKNLETLKLFSEIDQAVVSKNKQVVLENIKKFILNKDGVYDNEYGAAKDQLETLLTNSYKNLKITNHEVLQHLGFEKQQLTKLGVSDTKTNLISKAFELITIQSLKDKYSYVKDVVYCDDGKKKITINYYNATNQKNVDFILKIVDNQNREHFIAFDHKVKDYESCIKEISLYGFKYSVFSLGSVEDSSFYENPAVKSQLSKFSFDSVVAFNTENKSVANILNKQAISEIAKKDSENDILKETIKNITDYENTGKKEILLKTPLMPVLLINSKDIQRKILELQTRQGINRNIDLLED